MTSIEQTKARIARNMPTGNKRQTPALRWERESIHTLVTTCYRYRINREGDEANRTYTVDLTATTTRPGLRLEGGPFHKVDDAKAAAQAHFNQGVLPL